MKKLGLLLLVSFVYTGSLCAQSSFFAKDKRSKASYYANLPSELQEKMRVEVLPSDWSKNVRIGKKVPKKYLDLTHPVDAGLSETFHVKTNQKLLRIGNTLLLVNKKDILLDAISF